LLRAVAEACGIIVFTWRVCCFKPEPVNARDLRLWLSPDDSVRMAVRCLGWTEPGFNVI